LTATPTRCTSERRCCRCWRASPDRHTSSPWTTILVYEHAALSEAKARLSEIADEVDRTHERVHITRNGREYVVLLSAEDLESIEATLNLLSDTQAIAEIREADAQVAAERRFPVQKWQR
jgi:prevent-host-death family protein